MHKDRFEGRILRCPDSRIPSPVSPISMAGKDIPVQLSPVWPLISSSNVHKNNETRERLAETTRMLSDQLYRRQLSAGRIKGGSRCMGRSSSLSPGGPRLCSKLPEVSPRTDPGHRVSGLFKRLGINGNQVPRAETSRYIKPGEEDAPRSSEHNSMQGVSKFHRKCFFHDTGHFPSSTVLPSLAEHKKLDLKLSVGTRRRSHSWSHPEREAELVGGAVSSMEWLLTPSTRRTTEDPIGCLGQRLGSYMLGQENWRPMVPREGRLSHKLPIELLAIFLAIRTFAAMKRNITIQIQTDNIAAMTYVNKLVVCRERSGSGAWKGRSI